MNARTNNHHLPPLQYTWSFHSGSSGKTYTEHKIQGEAIVFVSKGAIRITWAETEEYIHASELCIIPSENKYTWTCIEDSILICSQFNYDLFYEGSHPTDRLAPLSEIAPPSKALICKKTVVSFFSLMEEYIHSKIMDNKLSKLKVQELIHLLFKTCSDEELTCLFSPVTGKDLQFKKFIINNYSGVKSVKELAELANYSTSGFIKKFQQNFNESPYRWMQNQKSKMILADIKSKSIPLKEIAMKYDFYSYPHFCKFCKTHFGYTPSEIINNKMI